MSAQPDTMRPDDASTLADLRAAQLFAHLDDEQLAQIAALARPAHEPADHTLFLQHDEARSFFLLAEGRIKVFKLLRDGRSATIRHVEAGQTFAEAALFHETYPSGAETLTPCRLYRFDTEEFLALLLHEPELSVRLLAAMAELLGLLNRRVEELLLPVPARLARYLLTLADKQLEPAVVADGGVARAGSPAGAGAAVGAGTAAAPAGGAAATVTPSPHPRVVKLPTSKRELASRLGTVPETLSRTFDRFKRAGVIRMSGDHELIEILDFVQLHRLAQD